MGWMTPFHLVLRRLASASVQGPPGCAPGLGPWRLLALSRPHGRSQLCSSTQRTPPAPPRRPPAGQNGSENAEAANHSAAPKSKPVPKIEPEIEPKIERKIDPEIKTEMEPVTQPTPTMSSHAINIIATAFVTAVIGGLSTLVGFALQPWELSRAFSHHLPRTTVDPPAAESVYVSRASAEHEMKVHLTGPPAAMLLLVGPKGSGKSTLVQHKLAGRPGAVAIDFTDKMHGTDMYSAIAKQVCPGRPALHRRASDKAVLISLLKRATADYRVTVCAEAR